MKEDLQNSSRSPNAPEVRVYSDLATLSAELARDVATTLERAAAVQASVTCALSGGETPRMLYNLLAQEHRQRIPWRKLQLFWSDERYVSHNDPQSNAHMVSESLLRGGDLPAGNAHPMPTGFADPDEAAQAYERELRKFFPGQWPRFDLALLGMGSDGHTASLFPGSPALDERVRWVMPTTAPSLPNQRLSLTLPVLNCAAAVYFLVAGAQKAEAAARVLAANPIPPLLPAGRVRPINGRLVWWLDGAAAKGL